jgi:hypothetical protein
MPMHGTNARPYGGLSSEYCYEFVLWVTYLAMSSIYACRRHPKELLLLNVGGEELEDIVVVEV